MKFHFTDVARATRDLLDAAHLQLGPAKMLRSSRSARALAGAASMQQQLALQQQQFAAEQAKLATFWDKAYSDIESIDPDQTDFKTHELPLARVKKIMRLEDGVVVSATSGYAYETVFCLNVCAACDMLCTAAYSSLTASTLHSAYVHSALIAVQYRAVHDQCRCSCAAS